MRDGRCLDKHRLDREVLLSFVLKNGLIRSEGTTPMRSDVDQ